MYGNCDLDLPEDQRDHWAGDNIKATLAIDPELSPAEVDAVLTAAEAWREVSNGKVRLSFTYGAANAWAIRKALPGQLPHGTVAWCGVDVITLGSIGTGSLLRGAVLHELGHFLGLGHEPSLPEDIMYPYVSDNMPTSPTPDAVSDLRKLYEQADP